jgi:subfamily B ATP-binding cassette protein MsbA
MMQRFRPYFKYLRAVRGTLIAAILCGILYGAANGGLPLMINYIFPKIFAGHGMSTWQVVGVAAWVPIIFLVRGLAGYFNSYLIQVSGVRILEAIRLDYFRKLQFLPLSFLQKQNTGDLISRGLADTNQLQFTLTNVANDGMKQPFSLLGSIGAIAYLAYKEQGVALVLVCLAAVPLTVFPVRYVGKKLVKRSALVFGQMGTVTNKLSENLSAAKEVRAFGLEEREVANFKVETSGLIKHQLKAAKYDKALTPAIEIISAIGIAFTLVYAYRGGIQWASFVAILAALYSCYDPIKRLGAISNEVKRGEAALNRLEVVFDEPIGITDPISPAPVGHLRGDLRFNGVTFAYKTDEPVLRNIEIQIPAGTVCALVGPSGAGKSTFANLVPRFYDVGDGAVTIDGIDVRSMKIADLRRNIAFVSQDPVLFNDTIFNNLLLGRPDATREEVIAAAKNAFADKFINEFPDGYDTIVGERGARLSGGQKQRLAVARAFLRNAPILILDEATSALDSQSEQMIQEALKHLVVGKTVLIIAHRFSTIRDASMILVFDQGSVVANGPHRELYEENGLYRQLYDRQAAGASV